MEQTAEPSPSTGAEIVLSRGAAGLGFNIRGGVDNPHIPGDNGIFVTKVRENGAAFSDGRLKEGDKILMINGKSLVGVTHEEAVSCFTRAKETVTLVVEHGAQAKILKQREDEQRSNNRSNPPKSSNSTKFFLFGVGGIGLIVAGIYIYKRFNKGLTSYR